MARVFIGLGSNLGRKRVYIRTALAMLDEEPGVSVADTSVLDETVPVGVTDQPMFLNGVAELRTDMPPRDLMQILKQVEKTLGRNPDAPRWGPRCIDLDILLYDDFVVADRDLKIPHEELTKREFVLRPLCQLAPGIHHPVLQKTLRELLLELVKEKKAE